MTEVDQKKVERTERVSHVLVAMICKLTDESGLSPYAQTSAVAQALAVHLKSLEDLSGEASLAMRTIRRKLAVRETCSTIIEMMEAMDEVAERMKK